MTESKIKRKLELLEGHEYITVGSFQEAMLTLSSVDYDIVSIHGDTNVTVTPYESDGKWCAKCKHIVDSVTVTGPQNFYYSYIHK